MEDLLIFVQEQALIVGALAVLIILFLRRESNAAGKKLSIAQVVQAMNAGTAVLLDIRETKEFNQGHVANAINIPHKKINDSLSQLEKYKDKQIIVTDQLGQHAGTIGKILAKEGYEVSRMQGGMAEWKNDNLPVVKS